MASQLPVACSLSGGEATIRAAELADLGGRAMIAAVTDGASATLRFDASAREALSRIVAAESECCPFFDFELTGDDAELRLKVSAPDDAAKAVEAFVAAFESPKAQA